MTHSHTTDRGLVDKNIKKKGWLPPKQQNYHNNRTERLAPVHTLGPKHVLADGRVDLHRVQVWELATPRLVAGWGHHLEHGQARVLLEDSCDILAEWFLKVCPGGVQDRTPHWVMRHLVT